MSRANSLINNLGKVFEAKDIKLKKEVKGLTFINKRKVKIPAGTYVNLGPDEDDTDSIVLSNDDTKELFIVDKGLLK